MADASDFLRVDFSRLLADPAGFEIGLAPLPDGAVAVRLRTGKGNGLRELQPAEVAALLSRFLEAIGGGTIMQDFDPDLLAAILEDVRTVPKMRIEHGCRNRAQVTQAMLDRAWVHSDSEAHPFTFLRVCEALQLDPDAVRVALLGRR